MLALATVVSGARQRSVSLPIGASMFLGEFSGIIDSEGELMLPQPYAALLAGGLVVTRGFERNLTIFTPQRWQALVERLAAQPLSDRRARNLRRRLLAGAAALPPDERGRVVLPDMLRRFAGLEGEIVLAGLFDHVEVWSGGDWASVQGAFEDTAGNEEWRDLDI